MSRILLVDDDQDLLTIAMNLLGREEPNFEIIAVLSASDALQKLATEHFDLIVADYQMPGMTGLELLKQLRTEGNDIPFIVFTGKGREEIAIDALNLGADRYLNKTGDTRSLFAELAHSIQSLIEHKKTKDALLEREIRFRELFANMSSGVAVYEAVDDGKDFIFKDLNAAGAKFTDLKKHDVLGVPVTKAFPSVKDFGLFDVFQNVWQTGKAEHHPASFYQDNRIARWYENFVYRLPSGEIVAVFDDVTKQKQAEEALRESNERYRSFVYSFPGIAFQGTMEFQPIFFHGASEEITGYTEAEFLEGNPRWDQCFHPHDLEKLSQSIEKIATIPGYSTTREYRIIRKDGQTRWIHEVIQNVPDQNGTPSYVQGIILDITDRKRAEEALQASEASFRMMFEYAPIGYHSLDENGIIQDVNHGWLEQLGYARTEAIGRPLKDFLAPSSREKFEHIFAQFKIAGEVHGIEYELVHKDSSELLVECDGRVQYDEEGNFERTHCTFRDITDRKQTEEALRESEEQFRLAFENANIGMCLVDTNGRLMKVNRRMSEIFGFSQYELESMTVNDITHPDDLDISPQFIERSIEGVLDHILFEKRYLHKKGHIVWGEVASSLVRNSRGEPLYFISHVRDITEQKLAEEALRENEAKYRSLIERANDGIAIVQDEVIHFVNQRLASMLGYTADEIVSHHFSEYLHPDRRSELVDRYQRRMAGEAVPHSYETIIRRKDGSYLNVELNAGLIAYQGSPANLIILRDITERKQAEEALRASEEKYRTLVEMSPDAIVATDLNLNITTANQLAAVMYGVTNSEDLLGMNALELIAPNEREMAIANTQNTLACETMQHLTYTAQCRDGSYFPVEVSTALIQDDQGEPFQFMAIIRDVSAQKQVEEALRSREAQYRAVVEEQTELICRFKPEGILTFVNDAYCRYFGKKRENLLGNSFYSFIAEEDRAKAEQQIAALDQENPVETHDERVITFTGEIAWQEWTNHAIFDENGQIKEIQAIGRDITTQKQIETQLREQQEELQESEKRYRDLVEFSPVAIFVHRQGKFLYLNPAAIKLHGARSADDFCDKALFDFVHPEYKTLLQQRVAQADTDPAKDRYTYLKIIRLDRKVIALQVAARQFNYHGEPASLVFCMDITEREEMEERLRQQKAELSDFAHAMAHDLKNNLLSIEGYADLLQTEYDALYAEKIAQLAQGMNEFLRHSIVLADAGLVVEKTEDVNLTEVVRSVAEAIIPAYITFKHDDLPLVAGDREKLVQIFQNLFENAVIHGQPNMIEVKQVTTEGGFKIAVSNDGDLIPLEISTEIFRRGFSTKEDGLGLGLTIVQKAIEAHGWQISLDAFPKTAFEIFIPFEDESRGFKRL